jgi:hypothetical protein
MSISISVIPLGIENLKRARTALESLTGALASKATDKLRVSVVDVIPLSPFNLTQISGTSLTARDWSQDFAKLQNIDTTLSSRASESTLSTIAGALASKATDKLRVSVVDALPLSPFNLAQISGTTLTGRDWSSDFAKLQNLDVTLSSFTGSPGGSAPSKGVVILGFDGTYLRIVKVTSDGKLLATLG